MGLGGWLGEVLGNIDDSVIQPLNNNILPGIEDTARNEGGFMDDLAHLDFDGMHERENQWEDIGNQMFGTGGWYKAAASYWLGPFADALANTIENKGDAEQSWTKAAGNYIGDQAASYVGDYMSGGTSDYSLSGGDNTYKRYSGDGSYSGVGTDYSLSGNNAGLGNNTGTSGYGGTTTAGDYSLASGGTSGTNGNGYGVQGNTYQAPGSGLQNSWANYKAENPTTGAAVEGGVKGGIKAGFAGGDIGKGFLSGATTSGLSSGLSQYSDYLNKENKDKQMDNSFWDNSSSLADSYGNSFPSFQQDMANNVPQANWGTDMSQLGEQQNWMDQLKANPWLQATLGFAGVKNPTLAALQKQFVDGQQRTASPWMGVGSFLGNMYNNNQQQQSLKGMLDQMNQNRGAYETTLRNSLARQDAARGRRSQYGPREVELQAKMAALDAQRAPSLMNMQNQVGQLRGQTINSGLNALWNNRDALQSGVNSIKDLYNSYTSGE